MLKTTPATPKRDPAPKRKKGPTTRVKGLPARKKGQKPTPKERAVQVVQDKLSVLTQEDKLRRLRDDYRYFARTWLKIRDKQGQVVPLILNPAQEKLTASWLRQLEERGRVRSFVPKARQMGSSTNSVAFLYWLAMVRKDGLNAYSLAHEDAAAKNFNAMVQRFDQHAPAPFRTKTRNAEHKLQWDNGSVWEFGTASTGYGGRGSTRQAIHFSEVAFWLHAESHTTGSLQGLGDQPGTVAIWESTARGPVGVWYELYRAVREGEEDMEVIFLPWFLEPAYVEDGTGFVPDEVAPGELILSEKAYQEAYGLSDGRMAWRRKKIRELNARGLDGALEFSMEYPADADEAFAMSGQHTFISPRLVEMAKRRPIDPRIHQHYRTVLGVDPAPAHGKACTAIIRRTGPVAHGLERWKGLEVEDVIKRVSDVMVSEGIARVSIDATEFEGQHIARMLRQVGGFGARIEALNFGASPDDKHRYANVRAERWSRMAAWLGDRDCSIPNEPMRPGQPTLGSELLAPQRLLQETKVIQVESKRSMASRGVPSPDGADALCCTFARTEAEQEHAGGNLVVTEHGVHRRGPSDVGRYHGRHRYAVGSF